MYQYKCFGLHLVSEVAFPLETTKFAGSEEVATITLGSIPDFPNQKADIFTENDLWKCFIFTTNGIHETFVKHKDGDQFYIKDGQAAVLDFNINGNQLSSKQFAFFSFLGLSTFLYHRSYFQLHGSGLINNGKGYIFMGDSGAGKSTTVFSLINENTKFVTDDVCLIKYHHGKAYLYPGIPFMKIMKDVYQDTDYAVNYLDLVEEDKFLCKIKEAFRHSEPVPLEHIFEISVTVGKELLIQEINGMQKFTTLNRNPARPRSVIYYKTKAAFLKDCFQLSSEIRMTKIQRPKDLFIVPELKRRAIFKSDFSGQRPLLLSAANNPPLADML